MSSFFNSFASFFGGNNTAQPQAIDAESVETTINISDSDEDDDTITVNVKVAMQTCPIRVKRTTSIGDIVRQALAKLGVSFDTSMITLVDDHNNAHSFNDIKDEPLVKIIEDNSEAVVGSISVEQSSGTAG